MNAQRNLDVFSKKKGTLIGYLLAGYPSKLEFLDIMKKCDKSKLDIIEIGLPSLNPYADGETIRNAHIEASKLIDVKYFAEIRKITDKPIWLMGYKLDIIETKLYLELAKKGLIDALVLPDISDTFRVSLHDEMVQYGVDVLGFVNPNMESDELRSKLENNEIVYEQLYCGPTGSENNGIEYLSMLKASLQVPNLIKIAGFGISTKEKCKELINSGFNGVVIGTEMIRKLNISEDSLIDYINEIGVELQKVGE